MANGLFDLGELIPIAGCLFVLAATLFWFGAWWGQPPTDEGAETAKVPLCLYCGLRPQMLCDPEDLYIKEAEEWRLEPRPSCEEYRHFCSGNCAKDEPDQFNYTEMRDCGCCGVRQNAERFEGDPDECYSDEGYTDY